MIQNIKTLKAISDITRLRILLLIFKFECISVSDLIKATNLPQAAISKALMKLRAAKLVSAKRKSVNIYYAPPTDSKDRMYIKDLLEKIMPETFPEVALFKLDIKKCNAYRIDYSIDTNAINTIESSFDGIKKSPKKKKDKIKNSEERMQDNHSLPVNLL